MSVPPEDQYPTDADRIVAALLTLAACMRPHPAGFAAEDDSTNAVMAVYESFVQSYSL